MLKKMKQTDKSGLSYIKLFGLRPNWKGFIIVWFASTFVFFL